MGLSLCLVVFYPLLLKLLLINVFVANYISFASVQPSCHDEERSALLQFKDSFVINTSASYYEGAYPKVLQWKSNNCCLWDGIDCEAETGYVTGLDLTSSCLFGSINSNSTLFSLVHLQVLSLSDNNFNFSQIPAAIGKLSRLTYLDLSNSCFFGSINSNSTLFSLVHLQVLNLAENDFNLSQIPAAIGKLSRLTYLDLSYCRFFGSINSNSTLFSLFHLQKLSLSGNNFNFSQIPAAIGKLSRLTYLDLSGSAFSGQIPLEISNLTKLSALDMSSNYDPDTEEKFLQLGNPNFEKLVRNLSRLEVLILSYVNISSEVPDSLTNFTSLRSLILKDCELYGDFPAKIFQLPNLQTLSVRLNENLSGRLPEFQQRSPLTTLTLSHTNFFGSLPYSIEKLDSLEMLNIYKCNFSGPIPFSLGKLTQLTYLDLGSNNFNGDIPSSLRNLTHLTSLSVDDNQITGPIPPWLGNLTKLNQLDLQLSQLHGPIPQSLFMLKNLRFLYLNDNNLGGNLKFDMFLQMTSLVDLQLGNNNLSLIFGKANRNATGPKFELLQLCSCNLRKFPHFLKHQKELEWLVLSENKIHGQIPNWMLNVSINTLTALNIASNLLTGFNKLPAVLPWVNLGLFNISFNMLQGPLPIPPPSISVYDVSNNMLTGEISPLFCNMSSLHSLDLSDNNLDGIIPPCLGKSSTSLITLRLKNNSLHGIIPQICSSTNASRLRIIDVSRNQLQGKLPRSLSNCSMLEGIVVSNNQLHDPFPSWLGSLPELKLLILHRNRFYGVIEKPKNGFEFSNLRVLDLSSNNFTGELPSQYVFNWNAMKSIKINGLTYMSAKWNYTNFSNSFHSAFDERYSMTIMSKGVDRYYEAIQDNFAFIDLSDNRFEGEISGLFGSLMALHSLNLSNNMLTGCIPSSLGNLTELESLDLSRNHLSCHIPQQLKQLGFLSSFNISHNNLTGPIPRGDQFNSFDSTSFDGNPELCGDPLPRKCANSQPSPSPSEEDHKDSKSTFKME